MNNLNPCPFCALPDVIVEKRARVGFYGVCVSCCGQGPAQSSKDEAIAAWNRRAPRTAPDVVEMLRNLAETIKLMKRSIVGGGASQREMRDLERCLHDANVVIAGEQAGKSERTNIAAQAIRDQEIQWAVGRWRAEVENRPLVNVHRRSLDDTWRQVIRHFGGDSEALCGPAHDAALASLSQPTKGEGEGS